MKTSTSLIVAATLATGAMSAAISKPLEQRNIGSELKFGSAIQNSAAYKVFKKTEVVYTADHLQTRQVSEPDPNRPATTPDLIFVLQCTDAVCLGD